MKLHKTFWLGPTGVQENDVDGIHFQVSSSPSKEDFLYEFQIVLSQFTDRYAMQARVFSDAWKAFQDCPEVWKLLSERHNCFKNGHLKSTEPFDTLISKLKKAGWKDKGRVQPRYFRLCSECSQEVVMRPLA